MVHYPVNIVARISEEHNAVIKAYCVSEGINMSELLREFVRQFVNEIPNLKQGELPLGEGKEGSESGESPGQ